MQKATLLGETPLLLSDGSINVQHFVAASNVFEDMLRCQRIRYKAAEMKEDEVLWYFLHLERSPSASEEDLYALSDQAKEVLRRRGVKERAIPTGFLRRGSSGSEHGESSSESQSEERFVRRGSSPWEAEQQRLSGEFWFLLWQFRALTCIRPKTVICQLRRA